MNLGTAIRLLREKRGLTQSELGELIGHSTGTVVSRWESGEVKLQRRSIEKLNRTLGVDIEAYARGELPKDMKIVAVSKQGLTPERPQDVLGETELKDIARRLLELNETIIRLLRASRSESDDGGS